MHLLLLASLSLAADPLPAGPSTCEATWSGPTEGCELTGSWEAMGDGRTGKQGSKRAQDRLGQVMREEVLRRFTHRSEGMEAADTVAQACAEVAAEQAELRCEEDPSLANETLCFAAFRDPVCGAPVTAQVEGVGWRAQEEARAAICAQLAMQMQTGPWTESDRHLCQERCLQEASVACH